jgi:beta-N-acetylhexosaminidase
MKQLLSEIPVGALMLFKYNIADTPRGVYTFISECTNTSSLVLPEAIVISDLPAQSSFPAATSTTASIAATASTTTPKAPQRLLPFVAIDHEGGAVYRLGQVATRLPPASRYLSTNPEVSGTASPTGSTGTPSNPGTESPANTTGPLGTPSPISAKGTSSTTGTDSTAGKSGVASPTSVAHSAGTTGAVLAIPEDTWYVIRQAAYLSGRELRALGITMNLAPVAEPLAPENRDFLQNRSFAANPSAVASAAAAFIQGMGEAGVVSVVKHFPASAAADPHHGRSVLTVDKKRLLTLASPFEALLQNYGSSTNLESLYPDSLLALPIQAGGVMIAHTMVPAIEPEVPSSLSSRVMQDWIKESIRFSGIVLADDFTMKAITSTGISPEAAIIRSLMAGSDMVMVWPRDLRRFHRLLVEQAKSDTLFRTRLVDAASRIINIKLLRGLTEFPAEFNDEGYGCMRKATEQFLRERNLR